MDALLYASLTRQTLSETLGGANFSFPDFVAGGSLHLGLRFSHRRDGKESTRALELVDIVAAIGSLDARPVSGTTRIKLGLDAQSNGANTTAELEVADLTAAGLVAAISALSQVGGGGDPYPTPTATDEDGTILLIFPGATEAVEINLANNELDPISLVRVVTWEAGGEIVHALRFIQTPAALSSGFEERVPPAPTIERHQAGGDVDGDTRTEIQILIRPPEFNGVFQLERDSIRSGLLSRADGVAQIKAALDPLADERGYFDVTNPQKAEAFIYFRGTMDGTAHDLLGVHVARAPSPDAWIRLDFDHAEFYGLLAAKDGISVPLHVRASYRDDVDEDVIHRADWILNVTAKRGLHWEGLAARAQIDFLRPPATSYVPAAVGAIITGNQHYVSAFPTSSDVGGDTFVHTHSLDTEDGHVAVRVNTTPGALLVHGTDYAIRFLDADQIEVEILPGGHFGTPVVNVGDPTLFNLSGGTVAAEGYLALTYTTAGPNSALLDHTQAIASVDELPETLADLSARLLSVENRIASGSARTGTSSGEGGSFGAWTPDPVELIYPISTRRRDSITDWPANLRDLLDRTYRGKTLLRAKAGSLLPAVHDAAVENISALSPAFPAVGNYPGRVFENNTSGALTIPGKGGRPSVSVPVGGFLACTTASGWYPVEKQESRTGDNPFFSSGYSSSSSEPAWAVAESTFYPSQFRHELFCFSVGKDQLTDARTFYFPFAFEIALLAANTKAQVALWVRFGRRTSATTPGTPGENLEAIEWSDPSLVQRIDLGAQPSAHSFAVRVTREADAAEARGYSLACEVEKYGTAEVSHPPLDAEFWVQGEILNFDTLDAPTSPEGFLCLSGLTLPAGYAITAPGEGTVGTAAVSS